MWGRIELNEKLVVFKNTESNSTLRPENETLLDDEIYTENEVSQSVHSQSMTSIDLQEKGETSLKPQGLRDKVRGLFGKK